jgi:hypothetical protein
MRGDRGCSRQVALPADDSADQGSGHPAYEYWGQSDPTREINRKVSKEEMAAKVSQMYSGKLKVKKCPKAHSLKRSADPVRS